MMEIQSRFVRTTPWTQQKATGKRPPSQTGTRYRVPTTGQKPDDTKANSHKKFKHNTCTIARIYKFQDQTYQHQTKTDKQIARLELPRCRKKRVYVIFWFEPDFRALLLWFLLLLIRCWMLIFLCADLAMGWYPLTANLAWRSCVASLMLFITPNNQMLDAHAIFARGLSKYYGSVN
jgi:hypothetical protein